MNGTAGVTQLLWSNAWAVIPLVVAVAVACRVMRLRPATRHMLWVVVLLGFVVPLGLPRLNVLDSRSVADAAATNSPDAQSIIDDEMPDEPPVALDAEPTPEQIPPSSGDAATSPWTATRIRSDWPRSLPAAGCSNGSLSDFESRAIANVAAKSDEYWPLRMTRSAGEAALRGFEADAVPTTDAGDALLPPISAGDAEPRQPDTLWESSAALWQAWLAGLATAGDALRRLPAIPTPVWMGGVSLFLGWQLVRRVRFRSRLRRAMPATRDVQREVARCARAMGLRRPPLTVMVQGAMSPLIWCDRQPWLVLPTRLWEQLDATGQRAILCHELAHLRRRDHWVYWVELAVAALYWWHPLVWWVRRRLHEEADLSCDAWVTWLMPKRRRQYAEALLQARQFVSGAGSLSPAGGMRVTSVGARRLARRLTMVMTSTMRPGASTPGLLLAVVVAVAGWISGPVWAWPDEPPAAVVTPDLQVAIGGGDEAIVIGQPPVPPIGHVIVVGDEDDALERQLDALKKQLDALSKQLDELRELAGKRQPRGLGWTTYQAPPAPEPPKADSDAETRAYRLPENKLKCLTQLMVREDVPVKVRPGDGQIEVSAPAAQQKRFAAFVKLIHPSDDAELPPNASSLELREYTLSQGKLDALTELMSLDNVPVLVQPMGDRLGVHGDERTQRVFASFVKLIEADDEPEAPRARSGIARTPPSPREPQPPRAPRAARVPRPPRAAETPEPDEPSMDSGEVIVRSYALPEGKLQALAELMVRADVPVMVTPHDDRIEVHGTKEQHKRFQAFIELIHPEGGVKVLRSSGRADEAKEAEKAYRAQAKERSGRRSQFKEAQKELAAAEAELAGQLRHKDAQIAALFGRSKGLLKAAEELLEKAERIREKGEALAADAETQDDEARAHKLRAKARELDAEARTIERRAEELEREAEQLEHDAERLEEEAESSAESRTGNLNALLEEISQLGSR